ncbi:transposase [Spirosoma sp. KCTC 42546]|uniref:transposase n=1 Tax=Spirosoma sp. KCTC 42546 TaxID=2520506 RepID=UPI001156D0BA|nr:transposase [Spirosoma sp. KCTC 42546]QDK83720.1 transposase [Spirosoma sp. KCTC 42546]
MRTNRNWLWAGLLPVMLLVGCGGSKEEEEEKEKKEEESVSTLGAVSALKEMANQAEELGKKGPVATVDFRTLKELLPADADGLPRKEATGEKNGAAGFTVSTAEGKYANEDGSETIELSLIDGGGSAMMMGLAAWSMLEIDKETENGYEKTTKIGDNKAYEKYDNANKDGEIAVLVNKRFIVSIKGRGVSMDKIKAALEDVDLDKLADLK